MPRASSSGVTASDAASSESTSTRLPSCRIPPSSIEKIAIRERHGGEHDVRTVVLAVGRDGVDGAGPGDDSMSGSASKALMRRSRINGSGWAATTLIRGARSAGRRGEGARLEGNSHRMGLALHPELGEDPLLVVLDRLARDAHRGRDLVGAQPLRDAAEHVLLALGQLHRRSDSPAPGVGLRAPAHRIDEFGGRDLVGERHDAHRAGRRRPIGRPEQDDIELSPGRGQVLDLRCDDDDIDTGFAPSLLARTSRTSGRRSSTATRTGCMLNSLPRTGAPPV